MRRSLSRVGCAILLVVIAASAATAQPSDELSALSGKTIRIIIGGPPNGGTDNYSRPFAEGLEALLPNTTVLVQNLAGGGGVLALIEAEAAGETTITLATIQNVALYGPIAGAETLPVDLLRFTAIGSFTHDQRILAVQSSLGATRFEEVVAIDRPLVIAVAGEVSAGRYEALILSALTGIHFRIIVGVDNPTRETLLLSGESDADLNGYGSLKNAIEAGAVVPILRMSEGGYPRDLDHVQTLDSVVGPGAPVALLETMDSFNRMGRLVLAAPSTDPAAIDALRVAFDRVMSTPALAAAYERQRLVLFPTGGVEVAQRLQALFGEPEGAAAFRAYVACGERRTVGEPISCTGL